MEATSTDSLPVIPLTELVGNDVPHLNTMQQFLAPHVGGITYLYWTLWIATLLYCIVYAIRNGEREGDRL